MVSQLSRVNSVKPSFDYIKNVYEPSLKQYLNNNNYSSWRDAQSAIQKGRKIIESDEEVDTYIAFYGVHHYYKLLEAFDALNISRFSHTQLEIFSYGCGAATDTCSLISYCRSKQINLPFQSIKLVEPSLIALDRGFKYIEQALFPEELASIKIQRIYKLINQLEKGNLVSNPDADKLHIFSNILDVQEIDLYSLASLIKETQSGTNYFICVNPKNSESKSKINNFYNHLSSFFKLSDIDVNEGDITDKKIWIMKDSQYSDNHPIRRYHRIFRAG